MLHVPFILLFYFMSDVRTTKVTCTVGPLTEGTTRTLIAFTAGAAFTLTAALTLVNRWNRQTERHQAVAKRFVLWTWTA